MSNITIQGRKSKTDTGCLEILLIVAIVLLWYISSAIKEIRQHINESKTPAIEQNESEVSE